MILSHLNKLLGNQAEYCRRKKKLCLVLIAWNSHNFQLWYAMPGYVTYWWNMLVLWSNHRVEFLRLITSLIVEICMCFWFSPLLEHLKHISSLIVLLEISNPRLELLKRWHDWLLEHACVFIARVQSSVGLRGKKRRWNVFL